MKRKQVRLGDLLLSVCFYPRQHVSEAHVQALKKAIEDGDRLPEATVDQNNRIVDGWHRCLAYARILSPDDMIWVNEIYITSDLDLYSAAVQANSSHGRPLNDNERESLK